MEEEDEVASPGCFSLFPSTYIRTEEVEVLYQMIPKMRVQMVHLLFWFVLCFLCQVIPGNPQNTIQANRILT